MGTNGERPDATAVRSFSRDVTACPHFHRQDGMLR